MTDNTEAVEKLAEYWADWLIDAVACATQNRMFLRGEKESDDIAIEAIQLNGEKAITNTIAAIQADPLAYVKPKPLEWDEWDNRESETFSACGKYRIYLLNDGVRGRKTFRLIFASFGRQYIGDFRDGVAPDKALEAAQAAAETHRNEMLAKEFE